MVGVGPASVLVDRIPPPSASSPESTGSVVVGDPPLNSLLLDLTASKDKDQVLDDDAREWWSNGECGGDVVLWKA